MELSAKLRPEKGNIKAIRKQGFVPAVLYGPKIKNVSVLVNKKDLNKAYKEAGESTLLKLKIEDSDKAKKENLVLIHDISQDPINDEIIHVDFYQPRLDKTIKAEVHLEFVGQSAAVATLSGVLVKNIHQVEVEALPQDLPREIKVDISKLNTFEDVIHIKDLPLPSGVKIHAEADEVVVLVEPPRSEAEIAELEKPAEAKPEEVKVEGEEKKAEAEAEEPQEVKEPAKEEKTK